MADNETTQAERDEHDIHDRIRPRPGHQWPPTRGHRRVAVLRLGSGTAGDCSPLAPAGGLPHDSLAEFLDRDYRRLVAGLALLADSRAAAEDAVQEALARAWERGQQITSLRGFVAVAATNLLRSRLRRLLVEQRARQRLGESLHGTSASPAVALAAADLRVDLARALQALPRRQREAVVLYYFADLSVHDLALALDARPDTAKGLLRRGRQSLLQTLGPAYRERGDQAGEVRQGETPD